jgi:hypothetical protein
MKTLPTQFDNSRLSSAVATPTCSSCCCCCCCLATSVAASSLLAQRVAKEGERHQIPNRHALTIIASLFVPIVGLLVYFGFWAINVLLETCTERFYQYSNSVGKNSYTVCTNPGSTWIFPLLIIVPFLVLFFLYNRVQIRQPLKRAVLVTLLIAIAFVVEFASGAALILTGVGAFGYILLVPIIVGWISVWYHKNIGKEVDTIPSVSTTTPPSSPISQLPTDNNANNDSNSSMQSPNNDSPTGTH